MPLLPFGIDIPPEDAVPPVLTASQAPPPSPMAPPLPRPPPIAVPSKRRLSEERPCNSPGACGGGGSGSSSYERPPPSALLTTFQRLGVSASEQEPKRLRVSPWLRSGESWPRADSPTGSPVDAEVARELHRSSRGSPCGGIGSPTLDDCEVDRAIRQSPSDHERLSPISQMLL